MAVDQLSLYNNALQLIGQRRLNTLTDDQESRYELDAIWDLEPASYCLELVKPRFASKTVKLNSSSVSVEHDLDNVFDLPGDFVVIVELYSDSKLDQPITRYIDEDRTIACEYDTVYLRYISNANATIYTKWSPTFTRVVASYLAHELAERINSDEKENALAQFDKRVGIAREVDSANEPELRSKASTTTLTPSWLRIYNDALLILGLTKITNVNDDSHRRSTLDTAIDADLVATVLEDIGWHWAITSDKLSFDPSLEPEWGYRYAYRKPTDMHRFDGIWYDEFFRSPIKQYQDEGDIIFCEVTEIYIQYVSSEFIFNPEGWTASFRRYIAAKLAYDAGASIAGGDVKRAAEVMMKRKSEVLSIDAQQSPPHILTAGNWIRSRTRGRPDRRRP